MTTKKFEKLVNEFNNEMYLIKKGVRSCFLTTITGPVKAVIENKEIIDFSIEETIFKLTQLVIGENLSYVYYPTKLDDGNKDFATYTFWIARYSHQTLIINEIKDKPSNIVTEWIKGKLLGYSDGAMETFLVNKIVRKFADDKYRENERKV